MIIQEPVQAAIWHCLNHYDYQDAVFLAERLCAEVETDETIFILATCYYRSNQIHQAYWLLQSKSPRSPQCRFLLAKCAYHLKKYSEAEAALTIINNNNNINSTSVSNFADIKNFEDICKEFGECACFVLQLIAKICSHTERYNIAIEALKMALKINPFLWNSFADLCNYCGNENTSSNNGGSNIIDPNSIFQIHNSDIFNYCQGNNTNAMVLLNALNSSNINGNGPIITTPTTTASTVGIVTPIICQQLQQQQQQQHSDSFTPSPLTMNLTGIDLITTPSSDSMENSGGIINRLYQQFQTTTTPKNKFINSNNANCMAPIIKVTGLTTQTTTTTNSLEDTPILYGNNNYNNSLTENNSMNINNSDNNGTPFVRQFKYLSALNQVTPSFGILPIDSPNINSNDGSFLQTNISTPTQLPPPATLIEMNQQNETTKSANKKLKGHVGSNIIRKDTNINANNGSGGGGPLQQTKSATVFNSQIGNVTPRTPNNTLTGTGQNVRRSSRLFSNNNSVKENTKSPNINKFAQPRSPVRKTKQRSLKNEINEKEKKEKEKIETITSSNDSKVLLNNSLNTAHTMAYHVIAMKKQSAEGLMNLLRDLGQGYFHLSRYNCKESIECFSSIPKHHFKTSWVQSMIALSHFERREYEAAANIFKEIHENDPYRLQLMEIYSTSLWHLQREVSLSALAQDLMGQDKNSPVTWCVAGNCFSLHKEHETAIKFFRRAVQVDPDFVYSYTLLGHELVITEELDKAMSCFRTAILKDPRHYNAWFGIGTIYSKQERYELAELHYKRALKINPKNSVIMVHIGAMQFFMQKAEPALQTLNAAIAVDPKNPLCKFHRGSMYYSLGKHQEALRELEELKQIVPKESVVFYLIGKIHKNLGNVDSALMHFSWATDLDPKGANNQLKDAFDSINHTTGTTIEWGADNTNSSDPENDDNDGDGDVRIIDINGVVDDSVGDVSHDITGGSSTSTNDLNIETDHEPNSERSDDSLTNTQPPSYDSDSY